MAADPDLSMEGKRGQWRRVPAGEGQRTGKPRKEKLNSDHKSRDFPPFL